MSKGSGGGSTSPQYLSSPPQTTTQESNTAPWGGQQGYLSDVFSQAQNLGSDPLQFYNGSVSGVPTGQTYTPLSSDTTQAMAMAKAQATGGDTVTPAAQQFSTGMLSGDYLSAGNPYFSDMVKNITNTVTPQVESQFEGAGRFGSGAMDHALASAVTDTAGNLAYQNYSGVLGEMGKANYAAPATAQAGYGPSQALAQVGGMTEDQTQNAINQSMSNWQFSQMEPWQRLGLYAGDISGNYGGSSSSSGTTTGGGQWINPQSNNSSGSSIGSIGGLLGGLGSLGMLAFALS